MPKKPLKMDSELTQIEDLINSGNTDKALIRLKELTSCAEYSENSVFWFLMGKTLWKQGKRSEATSAFRTCVLLDPNGPGKIALEIADDISSFFNPDILNP